VPRERRPALTERPVAFTLLFVAPALFAANMLTACETRDLVRLVTLAFWRWTVTLVMLLPFTLAAEALTGQTPRLDGAMGAAVLFLTVVASFGAYQVYALIQRTLGAGPRGLLRYLIPLYNGVLAWLVLGERLAP
jgi:drug/metabolite transporter (DMT)-like permease